MLDLAGNGAVLSTCGAYRWRLDRHVGAGHKSVAVFGVNPSTADASINDATVRKWLGFGQRLGWMRLIVGNIFSYRATDVRALASVDDLWGEEHDQHFDQIVSDADLIVPCWGSRDKLPRSLRPKVDETIERLRASGKPLRCWGLTASGDPLHPLMLGYDTQLVSFH